MNDRLAILEAWLKQNTELTINSITPASSDASARLYHRIDCQQQSYIVMDAPDQAETVNNFVRINKALATLQLNVPEIYASNHEQGFLLLEDFGDITYLQVLKDHHDQLYSDALESLLIIQTANQHNNPLALEHSLEHYDQTVIQRELDLFTQWYLSAHLKSEFNQQQQAVWQQLCEHLIALFAQQPQVWVHRDYHSRNLMLVEQQNPGILDFQDMLIGPISYDLASLFKDCYIEWPRAVQLSWLDSYYAMLKTQGLTDDFSLNQLIKWVDLTALQRHLKVLGIFARLHYQDNKSQYLDDLPLVLRYIHETLAIYPELSDFQHVFSELHQ